MRLPAQIRAHLGMHGGSNIAASSPIAGLCHGCHKPNAVLMGGFCSECAPDHAQSPLVVGCGSKSCGTGTKCGGGTI